MLIPGAHIDPYPHRHQPGMCFPVGDDTDTVI
jgi:hypothetical protein